MVIGNYQNECWQSWFSNFLKLKNVSVTQNFHLISLELTFNCYANVGVIDGYQKLKLQLQRTKHNWERGLINKCGESWGSNQTVYSDFNAAWAWCEFHCNNIHIIDVPDQDHKRILLLQTVVTKEMEIFILSFKQWKRLVCA